ncbi:hypothetical protein [Rhizobium leguminosarum]|uniref:hypothetical protein n=1 Tax=Rhizobium leguminosarum TaxID=384 RepID=UPI0010305A86|nr:hypothetical protein [Rhizobium leguminosarum]TAX24989.1 hypothetical protein ELI05_31725 [Rhizobium leguminosarum]
MERLRKVGEKAFANFLNDVAPATARALAKSLPPVKGFRQGSAQELIHQKRTLASKFMAREGVPSGDRTRSDGALYSFWRAWGQEHLGVPMELNDLLNEMEILLDQEGGPDAPEVSESIDRLFLMLKDASDDNRCSRENIERFFLFGPFEGSATISAAIASSKSAREVDRDISIHGLPDRLHRDEEILRSLDDRLNALGVELATLTADLEQHRHASPAARLNASDEIADRVREIAAELSKVKERTDDLVSSITAIETDRRHIVDQQELVTLMEGLERLVAESNRNERRHIETGTVFEALSRRLDELESLFLQFPQADADRTTKVDPKSNGVLLEPVIQPYAAAPVSTFLLERIDFPKAPTQILAEPIGLPTAFLERNLVALGLKKSSAERLATEILAAIAARCLVHFKGAFATLAARACATALSGNHCFRVAVPVGVMHASELGRTIASAIPSTSDKTAAIVLEGLNNVPVEAIADTLYDFSTGSSNTEMLLFSSLSDGPSALPHCTHLLDLGPIFDLDVLEWRLAPPAAAPMVFCQVPREVLRPVVDPSGDLEDFLTLLRMHGRRNPRRERRAVSHYKHLVAMSSEDRSALRSAAYGWLLPLWGIVGVPTEDMDHSLNGTNFEDDRLLRILEGFKIESADGVR